VIFHACVALAAASRLQPRRWIDMFEAATRRSPFSLPQKLLVQMAVRFRKRGPVSDEICSREQNSIP
jgi:hypothetical protein